MQRQPTNVAHANMQHVDLEQEAGQGEGQRINTRQRNQNYLENNMNSPIVKPAKLKTPNFEGQGVDSH